jgi:hypothetical protein
VRDRGRQYSNTTLLDRREEKKYLLLGMLPELKEFFVLVWFFFKKQTPQKQPGELERNSGFYDIVKNC